MSDVPPPKTLLGALFVGGIPLLMEGAAFYFTSGVTVRCERNASGHAACTEGRRFLMAIDVPLRRCPDVLGAASDERKAYDEDGDPYTAYVPVLLTPTAKEDLAPFGAGASLGTWWGASTPTRKTRKPRACHSEARPAASCSSSTSERPSPSDPIRTLER